jgi:hypothetical protein
VNPRAGLDDVEKIKYLTVPGLELRPLSHPARNLSLYRLRYPGSILTIADLYIYYIEMKTYVKMDDMSTIKMFSKCFTL